MGEGEVRVRARGDVRFRAARARVRCGLRGQDERARGRGRELGGGARLATLQYAHPAAPAEAVATRELDWPQQQLEADRARVVVNGGRLAL